MENRYGIRKQGSGIWKSLRDGDFEEDDVWDVLTVRESTKKEAKIGKSKEGPISAARMIPRASSGFSSSSNSSSNETKMIQQSAPLNIPDWSQIPKRRPKKAYDNDENTDADDDDEEEEEEEEEESDYSYKLPPHEVISRRLARSQISSFSVFEGVGRKLKGRDLSMVRNAVLVRTGFLESP
ncbi:protein S40-7 [Euphorbia lathyris]|uniref:protein S40-7 n=1 Tax=Euphorbia lathyris TaxID=212925 RepID=UPI0033134D9F